VISYADGQSREARIIYGETVRDWWHNPALNEPVPNAKVAWTGKNAAVQNSGQALRLYHFQWENPRPEIVVQSIYFTSTDSNSSPFLLAITAE
jgi:hypothetical protein